MRLAGRAIARSSTSSASVVSAPSAGPPVSRFHSCHGVRSDQRLGEQRGDVGSSPCRAYTSRMAAA